MKDNGPKGRHDLAMVTILFKDRTYIMRQVDLTTTRELEVDGTVYRMPTSPYRLTGSYWPFKARSMARAIFKDHHYNVDFMEGDPEAVTVGKAHQLAEHRYILPSSFTAMLNERGNDKMIRSMNKKNAMGIGGGKLVLLVGGVAAAVIILMVLMGGIKFI